MTASFVVQGLAPVLLAASLIWAAGVAHGGRRSLWPGCLLALGLAPGLAGVASVVVRLLWPALIGREWVLETLLALAALLWARRTPHPPGRASDRPPVAGWKLAGTLLLTACLAIAVWAAVSSVLQTLRLYPHGVGSDAFALWNLKARFLYRGGVRAWLVFDPALMHSRYPLLLPGLIARFWSSVSSDTPLVPQGLVLSFFGLVVGILVTTLHALRGWATACLAGLSLLSLPFFIENASAQSADLPLSLFALASLSCFVISTERPGGGGGALVLAGVFAGLAAWTKVEGLLLVLGLLGAVAMSGEGALVLRLRRQAFLLAGAVPLLVALFLVSAAHVKVPSEYTNQAAGVMLSRALSLDRHRQIVSAAWQFAAAEGQRVALALLALAAIAWRFTRRGSACPVQIPFLVALGVVGAGFYAVYLITPYPLDWQLHTSLDRLFIQYWPSLVLVAFSGGPRDE